MLQLKQAERYADFYQGLGYHVQRLARADIRYRRRRMHEALGELRVETEGARVLDVGFGGGELLASFPRSCSLVGAELSETAVAAARRDRRFARFASARFVQVAEGDDRSVPAGPFDVALSSHMLEHVPDDRAMLSFLWQRLAPRGVLVVFVPIEEPDYIPYHLRTYSLQSITERVIQAGFSILHVEGSMYVCGGRVWRWLTVPSRRQWPGVRYASDSLHLGVLCGMPYRLIRALDAALYRLGCGARQALVVARKS